MMLFCQLTLSGEAQTGDVSTVSVGGVDVSADHIEGLELQFGTESSGRAVNASTGARRGASVILPLRLLKRIDRTTPAFYRCHHRNGVVDGTFKLFDNDPDSGETRHRFSLDITQGAITAIRSSVATAPAPPGPPMSEWIEIQPRTITIRDEVHSTEYLREG